MTLFNFRIGEASIGVMGIRDIWVKNYRETGYLGEKLTGYEIVRKEIWGYQA